MGSRKVIVVGGGPAGLMAAGQAARAGARALLLEKMHRPGRKLRLTGDGRCNLTNLSSLDDFCASFGRNGGFLRPAFSRFFAPDLITFLDQLGVPAIQDRQGRVFPESNQAKDVVNALIQWAKDQGVTISARSPVTGLLHEDGKVAGVVLSGGRVRRADAVVLATGGSSYPQTGSTGEGFQWAKDAGHNVARPRPSLVPMVTDQTIARRLQGLSVPDVRVTLRVQGRRPVEQVGEVLFTHRGLSGPVIRSLSRGLARVLEDGRSVSITLDLKRTMETPQLDRWLLRIFTEYEDSAVEALLKSMLPLNLVLVCLEAVGIRPGTKALDVPVAVRRELAGALKERRFEITALCGFEEAYVTAGGVLTREVRPQTMGSRLVEGLYFAGEVLDLDADQGGFNLQAAFSTGWLAGQSAGEGR